MKKFKGVLDIVTLIVKYAGFVMVCVDTLVFFQTRIQNELDKTESTDSKKIK